MGVANATVGMFFSLFQTANCPTFVSTLVCVRACVRVCVCVVWAELSVPRSRETEPQGERSTLIPACRLSLRLGWGSGMGRGCGRNEEVREKRG